MRIKTEWGKATWRCFAAPFEATARQRSPLCAFPYREKQKRSPRVACFAGLFPGLWVFLSLCARWSGSPLVQIPDGGERLVTFSRSITAWCFHRFLKSACLCHCISLCILRCARTLIGHESYVAEHGNARDRSCNTTRGAPCCNATTGMRIHVPSEHCQVLSMHQSCKTKNIAMLIFDI